MNLKVVLVTVFGLLMFGAGVGGEARGQVVDTDESVCTGAGGIWRQFTDGCADSCEHARNPGNPCTTVMTMGCDCGESACWDEVTKSCLPNDQPVTPTPPLAVVCRADLNGDKVINLADIVVVMGKWGASCSCPEDLSGDGIVNLTDLSVVLSGWSVKCN